MGHTLDFKNYERAKRAAFALQVAYDSPTLAIAKEHMAEAAAHIFTMQTEPGGD